MDFQANEMPRGLVEKLNRYQMYTYRDIISTEHIFSIDDILERINLMDTDTQPIVVFTRDHKDTLNAMAKVLKEADIGYFRFVKYVGA